MKDALDRPDPAPKSDHTLLGTRQGGYLLAGTAKPKDRTMIRSWPFNTSNIVAGLGCRLSFWYAASKDATLFLQLGPKDSFDRFQTVWTAEDQVNLTSQGRWKYAKIYQDDLRTFAPEAVARFVAVRGRGYVAIDDVQVVCGDDRNEGVCQCDQGYSNRPASPGGSFNCTLDDGEVLPEPAEAESRCRPNAGCDLTMTCERGEEERVCGGGVTEYKSASCARCAYENSWSLGPCRTLAADDSVISTCRGTSTDALRYSSLCSSSTSNVVCMLGKNYRNRFCGLCNDLPLGTSAFNGYCSSIVSAQGEEVIDTCLRKRDDADCAESLPNVVCSTDGKQYKSSVW